MNEHTGQEPRTGAKPDKASSTNGGRYGLQPDEAMSEAGRKILANQFAKLLDKEAGTRNGEDIEDLHDMRVASRRMRAAIQIFEPYYRASTIEPLLKELRQAGSVLGTVRDLDVQIAKLDAFRQAHPEVGDLHLLLDEWTKANAKARKRMNKYLDSKDYRKFVADFKEFTSTAQLGAKKFDPDQPRPYQVRHVVPGVIWNHFDDVRAYETEIQTASLAVLHEWRIGFKRLRYALEFFQELLGPQAGDIIKQCTKMQDHLGDLHDADVRVNMLIDFLRDASRRHSAEELAGVRQYGQAEQAEIHRLRESWPATWQSFNTLQLRQALGKAVALL